MFCQLKSCEKCSGDLVLDGEDWRCWQCGTYYYAKPPVMDLPPEPESARVSYDEMTVLARPRRQRARRRTMTNINSVIMAKERSDQRWWTKNQVIIDFLNSGHSVREISVMVGKGQRQIRGVQERLRDLTLAA